jgi:hypothetical protein
MGSSNNRYRIDLPDGWEDQTVHVFMGPDDSGVQHLMQLIIDPDTGGIGLEEYSRNRIDAAMEALQGAEILKEESKTLPSGREAYECVYKWIPTDDQIIFRKTIYMVIDGAGYTFSANFSKKTLKTIGVEVERMIDSFRPGDAVDVEED